MKYIFGVVAIGILALFLFIGIAASKAGDGWRIAAEMNANNRAAEAAQRRELERDRFQAELPAIKAEAAEDIAFSEMLTALWAMLTWLLPLAAIFIILPISATTGLGLAIALPILILAWARSQRVRMDIRSRLIPLDPETGQYPILLERGANNLLCATNFNDNSILVINHGHQNPVPRKITGSSYIQAAGVLGRHASKARNNDGAQAVANINPPLITDGANDEI